jgi:hypothetical protein
LPPGNVMFWCVGLKSGIGSLRFPELLSPGDEVFS